MAKFSKKSKLPANETQAMVMDLCMAFAATKNSKEAAELLTDLLGKQELEMIAKRLKIADYILQEYTYEDIIKLLRVSNTTIARVHTWLNESGEGYRLALERTKNTRKLVSEADTPVKLSGIKKKYPLYFWPQIMLEEWVKSSSKKQKEQMRRVLNKLGDKTQAYKELDALLK